MVMMIKNGIKFSLLKEGRSDDNLVEKNIIAKLNLIRLTKTKQVNIAMVKMCAFNYHELFQRDFVSISISC